MRTLRLLAASSLLSGVVVLVPVAGPVTAHAVAPTVENVPLPTAAPTPAPSPGGTPTEGPAPTSSATPSARPSATPEDAGAPSTSADDGHAHSSVAPSTPAGPQEQSILTRDSSNLDVVGVAFPDEALATEATVEVRTRTGGTWNDWVEADIDGHGPDGGTQEARRAKVATEPVGVTGSDEVQVRVRAPHDVDLSKATVTLVDAGDSNADATIGQQPLGAAHAAGLAPSMITRAQWGADESLRGCGPDYNTHINGAVVHHTVNANTYSSSEAAGLVRGIYAYHTRSNGWCDIGYNFLVDRFGRLYEGRFGGAGRNVQGAQTGGFNSQTVGIASIGTHASSVAGATTPSSTVLTTVADVIAWKAWLNGWDPRTSSSFTAGTGADKFSPGTKITRPRVSGHQDFSLTSCPGNLYEALLPSLRTRVATRYQAYLASAATSVAAAAGDEVYGRPVTSSFALSGKGFGHGRGMSQYGAYGAALKGLSTESILAFYYPKTTLVSTVGNPTLRVWLSVAGSSSTSVRSTSTLKMTWNGKTAVVYGKNSDGSVRDRWRLVPDSTGVALQWYEKGAWHNTATWRRMTGTVQLADATAGKVRVVLPSGEERAYRRTVATTRNGSGTLTTNVLSLNYYLQSVVPSEMPASWSAAALRSQAVAARTYALYQKGHRPSGSLYDVCDSTSCQVFKGLNGYTSSGAVIPFENSATTAAVAATSGRAVYYGGAPALTEFSSANGGYTVASSLAYQVSVKDPYDNVPSGSPSQWTTNLSVASVERAFPSVGTLTALRITGRNGISSWGGRIESVTVEGLAGSSTVSGDSFRSKLGLRSTWWTVTSAPAVSAASFPKDLSGDGRGDLLAVDTSRRLQLLSGNGSGGFSSSPVAAEWEKVSLIANVGSWDGDSRHDVVERDGGTLYYHAGDGASGFFPRQKISSGWEGVDWVGGTGDMDQDGHTDFLARQVNGQLKIYRGDGKGGVVGTKLIGTGFGAYRDLVTPGDVTGDGLPDVVAIRASDDAMLLFAAAPSGDGRLSSPVVVSDSVAGFTDLLGPGDVTGDGRNDMVGRRASGALTVLEGNGSGGFAALSPDVAGTSTWGTWTRWAS
ncbi:SpoIID/LytB domain-containing protein [Phycicoccus sp. HDW14]|uniref:SpoIID/LytB domain-containing protein n=1 Tax=Phycicoccus sp. HDW14 TaxID=2714941 RepID=UPI0014094CD4|nr:SpoIID/LytB domain-containing protein [Phycicoccus sp. HDW14]QIM21460.1 SpoIID/LytB domain-containing protein [Phycicoccus sp. HDW14]